MAWVSEGIGRYPFKWKLQPRNQEKAETQKDSSGTITKSKVCRFRARLRVSTLSYSQLLCMDGKSWAVKKADEEKFILLEYSVGGGEL